MESDKYIQIQRKNEKYRDSYSMLSFLQLVTKLQLTGTIIILLLVPFALS